jgi:hypothetical protein
MDAVRRERWVRGLVLLGIVAAGVYCGSAIPTRDGTETPTPKVVVVECTAKQPVQSVSADPATITEGDAFTLRWLAPCGWVTITRKGGTLFARDLPSSGSYQVNSGTAGYPTGTGVTTYEVTNGDLSQRLEASVTVNARPGTNPTPTPVGATPTPTPTPGGGGTVCGNVSCESGETQANCCADCGCPAGQTCQNGTPGTCGTPPASCGDKTCNSGENCSTCPGDCPCGSGYHCASGSCVPDPYCGDGTCNGSENCGTCSGDCPCGGGYHCSGTSCVRDPYCGDGTCNGGENCSCGDCPCEIHQHCAGGSCVDDPWCGDGICNGGEGCGCSDCNGQGCDDGNTCTHDDVCSGGGCSGTAHGCCPVNSSCDDGHACSSGDKCQSDLETCSGSSCMACSGLMGSCDTFVCGNYCGTCYCSAPGTSVPIDCGTCP